MAPNPREEPLAELEKSRQTEIGEEGDSSSSGTDVDVEKLAIGSEEDVRERGADEVVSEVASTAGDHGDGDGDGDVSRHESHVAAGAGGGLSRIISRTLSRKTTRSSWNPAPPPDGGLQAWIAVACTHLVVMNTWGFINSFGVFQAYYVTTLARPPSDISWIGSLQVFLLFFIGTITGRLTDTGYFRHVLFLGCAFQAVGIFSLASMTAGSYWQAVLAQGVCMGLGNGFLFCPCVTVMSTYFDKRRSLAIGFAACGSATGGLVFPSMARQLLPAVGFPWTMRAVGFIQVATLAVSFVFLKTRIPPRRAGPIVDWAAFKEMEYTFYALGSFFCFLGIFFAFYYVASFSRDVVGLSYTDGLNLLLVLNGAGVAGRLGPNHLADRFGPITVFIPTAAVAGVAVLAWMAVDTTPKLYVWAVFYGAAAGGIQSLFPAGLTSLTTDLRKTGVRMGMVFTIASFGALAGPPVAGAILTAGGGRYVGAQAFAGSMLLVGSGFMVAARVAKARKDVAGWRVRV